MLATAAANQKVISAALYIGSAQNDVVVIFSKATGKAVRGVVDAVDAEAKTITLKANLGLAPAPGDTVHLMSARGKSRSATPPRRPTLLLCLPHWKARCFSNWMALPPAGSISWRVSIFDRNSHPSSSPCIGNGARGFWFARWHLGLLTFFLVPGCLERKISCVTPQRRSLYFRAEFVGIIPRGICR